MKKRFKFELEYTAINGRCAPKLKGYDDMELACCIRLIMILATQVYNYAKRSCIYAQRIVTSYHRNDIHLKAHTLPSCEEGYGPSLYEEPLSTNFDVKFKRRLSTVIPVHMTSASENASIS
jgi:hypothetical protein